MILHYHCIDLIFVALFPLKFFRNCPIDLKEAIATVIFATPRCSDIPELADVKKHMTSKYGKEFTSAALELNYALAVVQNAWQVSLPA